MIRFLTLTAISIAALSIAACTPAEQALNKPPGKYESSTSSTDANGVATEQNKSTSVGYDSNGNKKAVVKSKTTRDPPGLFNKSTTESDDSAVR
jgi:hypothetical protein